MNKGGTYVAPALRPAPKMEETGATNLRGRAARSNNASRFERFSAKPCEDGWGTHTPASRQQRTKVITEKARSIINPVSSVDLGFDRSINPYRGCEHGCIYCFARQTHAYQGLSVGQDFETTLMVKPDAARLLEQELQRPGYTVRHIAIGTNTDPYQPIEREHKVMREILQVLLKFRHPVGIVTKSALVLRDLDILSEMAKLGLVHVSLSITTLTPRLARAMEPRAATPMRRLHAVEELAKAGVPVGVMVAPIIPGLTDHELEAIMREAAAHGATGAGHIMLRLPEDVAPLFREWVAANAPDKMSKIMRHVVQAERRQKNPNAYFETFTGEKPYAELITARYRAALKRYGLGRNIPSLRTDLFRVPAELKPQLDLFADMPHQKACANQSHP